MLASPRYLFQLTGTIDRVRYMGWGCGLSLIKYAIEAVVIYVMAGRVYAPIDFLSPLLNSRAKYFDGSPTWLTFGMILWSLPFLWIGVAMSIRRCRDIDCSLWFGLFMLIPMVNYVAILCLSILRTQPKLSEDEATKHNELLKPWNAGTDESPPPWEGPPSGVAPALFGILAGVVYATASTVLSVSILGNYGSALFFGTPLIAGAVSAFLFNRPLKRTVGATIGNATVMIAGSCCALLLFALEGVICIVMALPIFLPITWMGAIIGRAIAIETRRPKRETQGMFLCLVSLPLLGFVEGMILPEPTFSVQTTVEIQASPAAVWEQVIAFPEITAPPEWFFRTGIAAPLRSRIEGDGVGAIRYCEFTTGTFVEPITVWEPNRRLAFDVSEQPDPMFELTPYKHVHPPHLQSGFRSTRGEFLLEPMTDGGTRLTGTTWYRLGLHPQAYWTLWSDTLVHRIHLRVLNHIQSIAENP